jgi:hypothetical protein
MDSEHYQNRNNHHAPLTKMSGMAAISTREWTNGGTYCEAYADTEAHKSTAQHQESVGIRERHNDNTYNKADGRHNKGLSSAICICGILGRKRTKHCGLK